LIPRFRVYDNKKGNTVHAPERGRRVVFQIIVASLHLAGHKKSESYFSSKRQESHNAKKSPITDKRSGIKGIKESLRTKQLFLFSPEERGSSKRLSPTSLLEGYFSTIEGGVICSCTCEKKATSGREKDF